MDKGTAWLERREQWSSQGEDARGAADVDYARVIHSASFRRLQGKTQILNLGDSDFYRTRLTHSLEVAQIANGIARQFEKDQPDHPAHEALPARSMIQASGATHDLGHPPFGHGGEAALNYCMRGQGGFEGNGQTLRILGRLEKFSMKAGANLTRRTLLSVLKYPAPFSRVANPELSPRLAPGTSAVFLLDRKVCKPPKCYHDSETGLVDWILEPLGSADRDRFTAVEERDGGHARTRHKSFDCSIMDLADDIAFGVHDLEDALALRLIERGDFERLVPPESCAGFLDVLKAKYPKEFRNNVYGAFVDALFGEGGRRKRFISRLVFHFITYCRIETREEFDEPLLRYRAAMAEAPRRFLSALIQAVRETVILSPGVQHLELKGQTMVVAVFETLASDPEALLPKPTFRRFAESDGDRRVICDHIAGMTDSFLLKTYDRLFSPRMGSVFDRL
ncbi:MAG TPA: anti-phage deoxyguanosine triphosphatase [Allosphingosinicella sp.]|nr:anti-phage deoxyguanosine triphosphatase [Allosphingosinicella sp.]